MGYFWASWVKNVDSQDQMIENISPKSDEFYMNFENVEKIEFYF